MGVKRDLETAGILKDDDHEITEDEAALYDRQIRLWGMECQKRLREAKFMFVGLNGVTAETVKNLTLIGVKSITLLDDKEVTPHDLTAQFFLHSAGPQDMRAAGSVSAIKELNPNVIIQVVTGDIFTKPESFFSDFHALVATDCSVDKLIKLNELCRQHSIQFYSTDSWGFYGYCFLDLNVHNFIHSKPQLPPKGKDKAKVKAEPEPKPMTFTYKKLSDSLAAKVGSGLKKRVNKTFVLFHVMNQFRESHNRYPLGESRQTDFEELKKMRQVVCQNLKYEESKISDEMLSCVFGQISPVCAIVGGVLANEIIKGISKDGPPIHNYFLFDGNDSVGVNEAVLGK